MKEDQPQVELERCFRFLLIVLWLISLPVDLAVSDGS